MANAPDTVFLTGETFEQLGPQDILVTPQGRAQTTLAAALAAASGSVVEVVVNAPEFLNSATITTSGTIVSGVTLANHALLLGSGPGQPIRSGATLANAQILVGQSGDPAPRSVGGDLTMDNTGAFGLVASGVTAGVYGDSTHVGQFDVDSAGRVLSASSVAISAGVGTISAGSNIAITNPTGPTVTVAVGTLAATSLFGNYGTVAGTMGAVTIGSGLSLAPSGTLTATGGGGVTLSAHSILGNDGTVSAAGTSVAIGANLTLNGGTLSASAGSGFLLQAQQTLSSAQILGLNATPVTLVSAPGVGFMVKPIAGSIVYRHVSAPYTGGGNTNLFYGSSAGSPSGSAFASAFTVGSNRVLLEIVNTSGTFATAQVDNLALVLQSPTAFAGGDGTALLTVDYVILPSS